MKFKPAIVGLLPPSGYGFQHHHLFLLRFLPVKIRTWHIGHSRPYYRTYPVFTQISPGTASHNFSNNICLLLCMGISSVDTCSCMHSAANSVRIPESKQYTLNRISYMFLSKLHHYLHLRNYGHYSSLHHPRFVANVLPFYFNIKSCVI